MKSIVCSALALALTGSAAFAQDALPQQNNDWFTAAQAELARKAAVQPITKKARNVILLVADGNGVGTNYATRLFDGQQKGNFGDENVLAHETFPHLALAKTYNVNAQTPDSAGTGTAMHTGVKTKAGVIGVDETLNRGDCSQVEAATIANAAEVFSAMGKSVGVISTARLTHATPASAYAHAADRNFEDNSKLPEGCAVPDIAAQMIEAMKDGKIDIALGGGRRHFLPKDVTDEEGKGGKRTDGKNLIEDARAAGVQYVHDDETFKAAKLDGTPVLGLFESSHMKYEADRTGEPSLAEMTEAAIKALQTNDEGFFLTIEAGRVDHANHDGNLARVVRDGVAFADAVAKADELTNDEDTLIIVTADHEHAIAFQGYAGRGSDILGLSMKIDPAGVKALDEPNLAADGKPYTTVGYLNGTGTILTEDQDWFGTRPALTQEQAIDLDYVQQALIPMSSETHSGEDVAIYAKGPFAHLLNGTVEQNLVFHIMQHAASAE
ncbi:alkaline phosphatase [Roseibium sp.]|uniref:alkaline phosphatase n=1 Tax=Roseibium sp. TaxID=1936156 RepID=UPI003D117BD1